MSAQSTSGKGARPALEGEEEVGAAQHDRLGAALAHQSIALTEEDITLLVGDAADRSHA